MTPSGIGCHSWRLTSSFPLHLLSRGPELPCGQVEAIGVLYRCMMTEPWCRCLIWPVKIWMHAFSRELIKWNIGLLNISACETLSVMRHHCPFLGNQFLQGEGHALMAVWFFPLFIITAYSCWVSFNCLWSWAKGQCWQFGSANFCSHTTEEWTDSRWGVAFHPALCASEWTHLTLSPWDFVISSVSTNVWRLEALPRLNCRPHASRAYLLTPHYGKRPTIYLMKCVLKLNYKNSGAF